MKESDQYNQLLNSVNEGIYFVDVERQITFWNKGAERITGFSKEEVTGSFCYDNLLNHVDNIGTHLCQNGCPLHLTIQDEKPREVLVYLHHKKGHRVPVQVRTIPLYDDTKSLIGCIEIFSDESHSISNHMSREELHAIAFTDALTGLPNRRAAESQIRQAKLRLEEDQIPFAVALVDIDYFKKVNDTYGHDIGDEVLKIVAKTLDSSTRLGDMASRWGGEEFLLILSGITEEAVSPLLEKIRLLVENSQYRSEDLSIDVTVSIGASMGRPEEEPTTLFKRTDTALYDAKQQGRNRLIIR
jgi:diguanylate cyclase (GGDEF)-like protein/PAS domain S-box-containing protein